jgi:hypothetical protein
MLTEIEAWPGRQEDRQPRCAGWRDRVETEAMASPTDLVGRIPKRTSPPAEEGGWLRGCMVAHELAPAVDQQAASQSNTPGRSEASAGLSRLDFGIKQ